MTPRDPRPNRWGILARIVAGVIVVLLIAYAVAWLFGYLYPRPGEPFYDPQGQLAPAAIADAAAAPAVRHAGGPEGWHAACSRVAAMV